MNPFTLIVLAAGKGTRLKSELPKVLHPLFARPLLLRVLDAYRPLAIDAAYVVVGHGREQVEAVLNQQTYPFSIKTVVQNPPRGTGDAVRCVQQAWADSKGNGRENAVKDVVIVPGDAPLFRTETLNALVEQHRYTGFGITLLTADYEDPTGYGRVITEMVNGQERVIRIVEEKDATSAEKQVKTINTGVYCIDWNRVSPLLGQLNQNNAQGEFYLTDIIALAQDKNIPVGRVHLSDPEEALGINSRQDLANCHQVLNRRTLSRLMAEGVTILDPNATWVSPDVSIGPDTVVYPGCYLEGVITIGHNSIIGPNTLMQNRVTIGSYTTVIQSVLRDAVVEDHSYIGPFAQLRDDVHVSHHVKIGNFVEVKNARIDHHSNAAHLAYIGDARLGVDVNMGAGTITANYDPIRDEKHETVIRDGAKIGCNAVLVAPVEVGEQACVAAGSVITRNVEPLDLAIARPKQSTIPQWVSKIKKDKAPAPTTPA